MSQFAELELGYAARCGYWKEVQMNEKLKLIGAAELAEILGISLASLYRRRSLGDALPPAVRIGSLIRWRVEDI